MTRRGKIARLPKDIREKLNSRLQNGETMAALAQWLNGLRDVQTILKAHFRAQKIRIQNISEWKNGGYIEWQKAEEEQGEMQLLRESAEGLSNVVGGTGISDCFTTLLSARMTSLARKLLEEQDDPAKQWKHLCEVNRQFSRLRRDDHRRLRAKIKLDQWAQEIEQKERYEEELEKIDAALLPKRLRDYARRKLAVLAPAREEAFQKHLREVEEFEGVPAERKRQEEERKAGNARALAEYKARMAAQNGEAIPG